ncbi:unnamed protein product, partial [Phaeothamnion confervicola]
MSLGQQLFISIVCCSLMYRLRCLISFLSSIRPPCLHFLAQKFFFCFTKRGEPSCASTFLHLQLHRYTIEMYETAATAVRDMLRGQVSVAFNLSLTFNMSGNQSTCLS